MPRLVRLYINSALIGFLAAAVFVAMIYGFNVANIGHLVSQSDIAVTATLAFWVLNGIVFSGVQFGYAIMQMAERDPHED